MNLNTDWRKTASTIYQKPTDSKIFGSVEIDITELDAYIKKRRSEGLKITLTHIVTLATARAIAQHIPAFNTYIQRGNVKQFEQLDAMISVLQRDGQMSSTKLLNADKLSLQASVEALQTNIFQTRNGKSVTKGKNTLAYIPWPFRNWVFSTIKKLTVDWGLNIFGLSANQYGTFIVSNIGTLGLDMGYPALLPTANVSFVLIIGGVRQKPWVVNNEVVPRTIVSLGAAIDHRIVDASHAGKLFYHLKQFFKNPEILETPPTTST